MTDAPIDLANLKDDLGIIDNTQDAWLQRRVNGIWSRIEAYTARKLCAPPAPFVDDWGLVFENQKQYPAPPALWHAPSTTVFLRYFPVSSIDAVEINGNAGDASGVRFDPKTGKLFALQGETWLWDISHVLVGERVKVTYKAGWDEIPADLYEVVLGAVNQQWSTRQSAIAGGVAGTPTKLDIIDVGSVDLDPANLFVDSAAAGGSDPLLGPYASMLDLYVDHRSLIGWALAPVTTPVAAAKEAPP